MNTLFELPTPEYILSIRNEPAEAMLKGTKPHEFRRKFDTYTGEIKAYLYVTSPRQQIIGHVIFREPIQTHPNNLIKLLRNNKHDQEDNLRQYFQRLTKATALPVKRVVRYRTPIPLSEIRRQIPGFQPPMSYLKLTNKHERIRKMLKEHEEKDEK